MSTGVLALQGCVEPHLSMLAKLGEPGRRVKSAADLDALDRLIIPGGESTTMLKLLDRTGLERPLLDFAKTHPVWGICAGAILIARQVEHPAQHSLGLMNIRATRNYYGSQRESFAATLDCGEGLAENLAVDFIRAPLLEPLGAEVTVLAKFGEQPVLLRQGPYLASAFHVELGEDTRLHSFFISLGKA